MYGEPIVLRGSERVDFVEQSYQVGTCSACMDPHSVDGVPPVCLGAFVILMFGNRCEYFQDLRFHIKNFNFQQKKF